VGHTDDPGRPEPDPGADGVRDFDGSDYNSRAGQYGQDPSLCTNPNDISTGIPAVLVTVGTTTTNFSDTGQILNTHGVDGAGCVPPVTSPTRDDES
jgi:hypothetical protein